MEHAELLERFSAYVQTHISEKMDQPLANDLLAFVARSVREDIYATPGISSRLSVVCATAAGQLDAIQAHLEKTFPGVLQDVTKAATKHAATVLNDEVRKIVRESVKISFTGADLDKIREEVKEELKREVKEELKRELRKDLMDEIRAELRNEDQDNAVGLPHRPAPSSRPGKKRGRKPKGA